MKSRTFAPGKTDRRLEMKLATIASTALLLNGTLVFAGNAQAANVAVPAEKCNSAWSMASPGGDTIVKGATTPLVLDFTMVDTNKDGSIDKDEFNKACSAGLVKADEATVKGMK
jgi:hypothetical protein